MLSNELYVQVSKGLLWRVTLLRHNGSRRRCTTESKKIIIDE